MHKPNLCTVVAFLTGVVYPHAMNKQPSPVADDKPAPLLQPAFVLLFALTPDHAARHASQPSSLQAIPSETAVSYRETLESIQQRLLGEPYLQARRLSRVAMGRIALPVGDGAPAYADIHRVQHKSGAAVWEVWLSAPKQALGVPRWVAWLDMDNPDSLAQYIWRSLVGQPSGAASQPEIMLPLIVLQCDNCTLPELLRRHGHALVKLLHRDSADERFKADFVQQELATDFCRREHGLSLLSRQAALDVHAQPGALDDTPLPRNTLPLLVTLELLCLERVVLRSFLNRFVQGRYATIDDLVQLRRDIFDGLEEYYGTLAKTHGYTAEATALGEKLFGIDDLFNTVTERLEALTFEITSRNQATVNRLGVWLTTSFGAIETGFVAASIATWYYRDNLWAVLGWTGGVTLTTMVLIAGLLRWRIKR